MCAVIPSGLMFLPLKVQERGQKWVQGAKKKKKEGRNKTHELSQMGEGDTEEVRMESETTVVTRTFTELPDREVGKCP